MECDGVREHVHRHVDLGAAGVCWVGEEHGPVTHGGSRTKVYLPDKILG